MNELSAKVTYASVTPIAENSLTFLFVLDRVFSGGTVIRTSDIKYAKKLVSGKALLLHLVYEPILRRFGTNGPFSGDND